MANYGVQFYGADFYGQKAFLAFSANPFVAKPYLYGSIRLQWASPVGNWSRIRLVRSSYGHPVQENDGLVLLDKNIGPSAVAPLDTPDTNFDDTLLTEGNFYYYSLFVLATDVGGTGTSEWRRAGTAIALAPKNHHYTERMLERIPSVYTTDVQETGGQADEESQFRRFLSIFGFDLDLIRTQYESLRWLYDPDKVSGAMLPILARQMGQPYEPELGMRQTRILLRNLMTIRKRKGTILSIEALASSFTGWAAEAEVGYNRVLSYDDSSFEDSVGTWQAAGNCTIARRVSDEVVAGFASTTVANLQGGMLDVTSTGGNALIRQLLNRDPVKYGIPVTPGLFYTASTYSRSGQAQTRNALIAIEWYTERGVLISTTATTGTASSTNFAANWNARPFVIAQAPATAAYAGLQLGLTAASTGERHYFDGVQFEQADRTNLVIDGNMDAVSGTVVTRTNLLPNPIALNDANVWSGWPGTGGNAAVTRQTGQTWPDVGLGPSMSTSARFTWSVASTAPSGGITAGGSMPVTVGQTYTVQVSVRCSKVQRLQVGINWRTSGGADISFVANPTHLVTTANTATTMNATLVAPANAAFAGIYVYTASGTSASNWAVGDWLEVTAAHFEEGTMTGFGSDASTSGRFHGSLGNGWHGVDHTYTWAGTAHASASQQRAPALTHFGGVGNGVVHQSSTRATQGTKSEKIIFGTATAGNVGDGYTLTGLTVGKTYTYSRDVYVPTGAVNVYLSIDNTGVSSVATTKDAWVRLSMTFVATATTHGLRVLNAATNVKGNSVCWTDGFLVEEGATSGAYTEPPTAPRIFQEARDIRIRLKAERINEIPNPSAEVNTTGWNTYGGNVTIARSTSFAFSGNEMTMTPTAAQLASFRLTATALGAVVMESSFMPVLPGQPYTFSAYCHSPGDRLFRVIIHWYTDTTFIGSSNSEQTGTSGTKWFRHHVTSISPDNATRARVLVQSFDLAAGTHVYFDGLLLENTLLLKPYFDAHWNFQHLADYMWEGGDTGIHSSRSHYYFNRTTKNLRLKQLTADHVMPGTTFSLLYAQPGLT